MGVHWSSSHRVSEGNFVRLYDTTSDMTKRHHIFSLVCGATLQRLLQTLHEALLLCSCIKSEKTQSKFGRVVCETLTKNV